MNAARAVWAGRATPQLNLNTDGAQSTLAFGAIPTGNARAQEQRCPAHARFGVRGYGARARGPITPSPEASVFQPFHRDRDAAGSSGWFALLRRHLALAIAVKLALLALLFFLFFSATHRPAPGPAAVSELLHLSR